MARSLRVWMPALAVAALSTEGRAQADSQSIVATVQVVSSINLSSTQNLDFGQVLQNSGIVNSSNVPTRGAWSLANFTGGVITFTLPGVLVNREGTASIPIMFGPRSALLDTPIAGPTGGGGITRFDPANGLSVGIGAPAPSVLITLGEELPRGTAGGDVAIDVGNVPTGVYSGTIILTVALP